MSIPDWFNINRTYFTSRFSGFKLKLKTLEGGGRQAVNPSVSTLLNDLAIVIQTMENAI